MLFKYCFKLYITQGILLHTLHGHTYTLNLHVQVYIYISVALFVTTFITFISFIYFEGERDLPHMTVTGPVQSLDIATKLQLPNEISNKEEQFWLTS